MTIKLSGTHSNVEATFGSAQWAPERVAWRGAVDLSHPSPEFVSYRPATEFWPSHAFSQSAYQRDSHPLSRSLPSSLRMHTQHLGEMRCKVDFYCVSLSHFMRFNFLSLWFLRSTTQLFQFSNVKWNSHSLTQSHAIAVIIQINALVIGIENIINCHLW